MFLQTLESGIVIGQGLKVVPEKCVKNNKRKAWTIWQTELSKGKLQNPINKHCDEKKTRIRTFSLD